jgi:hypothetical protein
MRSGSGKSADLASTAATPETASHGTGSLTFIAELDTGPDGHLRLTNNPATNR